MKSSRRIAPVSSRCCTITRIADRSTLSRASAACSVVQAIFRSLGRFASPRIAARVGVCSDTRSASEFPPRARRLPAPARCALPIWRRQPLDASLVVRGHLPLDVREVAFAGPLCVNALPPGHPMHDRGERRESDHTFPFHSAVTRQGTRCALRSVMSSLAPSRSSIEHGSDAGCLSSPRRIPASRGPS